MSKAKQPPKAPPALAKSSKVEMVSTTFQEPKELKDVRVAIRDLVSSIREAGKDGFQAASDIPTVVFGNLKSLGVAFDGFDKLDDAFKEELGASLKSTGLLAGDIAAELTKK